MTGPRPQSAMGFTIIESAMAIVLVSIMLVSSLRVLGSARAGELTTRRRAVGLALAEGLVGEIVRQAYQEPGSTTDALTPGGIEVNGTRSLFDDVDDYNGWTAKPPQAKDGTPLVGFDQYKRSVVVEWVDPNNLTVVSGSTTGVKRVTVTVRVAGRDIAQVVAYRTNVFAVLPGDPS